MAERDQPALARRIQQLAESGDYEGFNAILGSLDDEVDVQSIEIIKSCLLYTSPSPRDKRQSRMPSSA